MFFAFIVRDDHPAKVNLKSLCFVGKKMSRRFLVNHLSQAFFLDLVHIFVGWLGNDIICAVGKNWIRVKLE